MSRFSDKCDFADTCLMHYTPDKIACAKISIDGIPLKVTSPRDLIPYYGNLIASMSASDNGDISINLIKTSQPRLREIDTISFFISDYVSRWKRAKRNKTTLTFEDFKVSSRDNVVNFIMYKRCEEHKDFLLKMFTPYASYNEKIYNELVNGKIIDMLFSDIHTAIGTFYRKNLLEYAADFWGNQLKLSKEDYIVWSQCNPYNNENYCLALLRILQEVWEYDKAIKIASEELEIC